MSSAETMTRFRPAATSAMERANVPSVCGCCGREELVKTVKVISADGTIVWMGTGCAAKACGMGVKDFGRGMKRAQDAQDSAEKAAADAAHRAEDARWQAHLDAKCPALRGKRFEQLQALGGYRAARADYPAAS
jgi:hypothetical protein